MIERTYRVLDKILRISLENAAIIPNGFEGFQCAPEENADVVFLSDGEPQKHCCYGICYLSDKAESIHNVFFSQKDKRQLLYSRAADYSQLRLQLDDHCTEEILSELLMAGFYSHVSLQETLLLHAAGVLHEGKALVFTAPSGVGKTTQAELWQKYRNAAVMNGDKIFLKKTSDKIMAWGSPWKGSSPYGENVGAELAAIVVLEQAEENQIRKLSGMEVLERCLPHVFFPGWDARCENAVLDLLNEVLTWTDVYLLRCRPDEDAVALVEKTVF